MTSFIKVTRKQEFFAGVSVILNLICKIVAKLPPGQNYHLINGRCLKCKYTALNERYFEITS